jgi:hypothetical protein
MAQVVECLPSKHKACVQTLPPKTKFTGLNETDSKISSRGQEVWSKVTSILGDHYLKTGQARSPPDKKIIRA